MSLDSFVEGFRPLVIKIAVFVSAKLPGWAQITVEDLQQVGFETVVRIFKDKTDREISRAYVFCKVHYALVDALREEDVVSRSVRKSLKDFDKMQVACENSLGRSATLQDLATHSGATIDEMSRCRLLRECSVERHYDGFEGGLSGVECFGYCLDESSDPLKDLVRKQNAKWVSDKIEELPRNEATVLDFIYNHGLDNISIASLMRVSESRISQLKTKGIERLQRKVNAV